MVVFHSYFDITRGYEIIHEIYQQWCLKTPPVFSSAKLIPQRKTRSPWSICCTGNWNSWAPENIEEDSERSRGPFPERSEAFEDLNQRLMEEKLQVATTSASWPWGHLFWRLVVHFGWKPGVSGNIDSITGYYDLFFLVSWPGFCGIHIIFWLSLYILFFSHPHPVHPQFCNVLLKSGTFWLASALFRNVHILLAITSNFARVSPSYPMIIWLYQSQTHPHITLWVTSLLLCSQHWTTKCSWYLNLLHNLHTYTNPLNPHCQYQDFHFWSKQILHFFG